jgi:hypothetical protein
MPEQRGFGDDPVDGKKVTPRRHPVGMGQGQEGMVVIHFT